MDQATNDVQDLAETSAWAQQLPEDEPVAPLQRFDVLNECAFLQESGWYLDDGSEMGQAWGVLKGESEYHLGGSWASD